MFGTRSALIDDDLQIGQACSIIEFQEREPFGISPRSHPTLDDHRLQGLNPVQDVLDQLAAGIGRLVFGRSCHLGSAKFSLEPSSPLSGWQCSRVAPMRGSLYH